MSILVVDDEPDIQFLFQQRFRKEIKNGEMDFQFAFSGEEAVDYLKRNSAEIVLILSDINMPGMNGFDLLKYIKQNHEEIKVIMVTAYGDEQNYNMSIKYGADDFVTKPINFEDLKDKIREYQEN